MKKYIGKKWGQLTVEQQEELRNNIVSCIDGIDCKEVEERECIVDFEDGLSISGYVLCHSKEDGDYEVIIDNNSILYDPNEGGIVENEKFKDLISLKDAAALFGKEDGTLRMNIRNGFFKEWEDCIKLGTTWVFDINALEKKYGKRN